ncbi:hypothetical protein HHK36_019827 [Tetracentron sinense]|uniref:Uncharacterized protein n=1 Tax=Tetracentron sinense TaxID=13715 RepID=A0A834Z2W2_TETSI|nr:hypothetical protein HHK36_019827 [Tetracentron sinense]
MAMAITVWDMSLSLHFVALYSRHFYPNPIPSLYLWFLDIFQILFCFWSKFRDLGPSRGSLPYQHQALRGWLSLSLSFGQWRDLGLSMQLVALCIRIFYSYALALLPEIIGLLLLVWCLSIDVETRQGAERSEIRPDAKQPSPTTIIPGKGKGKGKDEAVKLDKNPTDEIDKHGGTEQFGSADVADSRKRELPNSESEDILDRFNFIIAGLQVLADSSKDTDHK